MWHVNVSAQRAIEQYAEALADLRRAVGSPSFRTMESLSGGRLPRSTAADVVAGHRLPGLLRVFEFVAACQKCASSNGLEIDHEDFDRTKWLNRWYEVKKLSSGRRGQVHGDAAAWPPQRLYVTVDVEELRQRIRAGDMDAAELLGAELVKREGFEGLMKRAAEGDWYAQKGLYAIFRD
jgi:hypothetical protein